MAAAGTETIVIPSPPEAVLAAVRKVIETEKYTLVDDTAADRLAFVTRKTGLNWELDAMAVTTAVDGGTQLSVTLTNRPDRPKALLDGAKNKKAAKKLAGKFFAAV